MTTENPQDYPQFPSDNDPSEAAHASRVAIAEGFEAVIDDAEDLMQSTADAAGAHAASARAKLTKSITSARELLAAQMADLTDRGRKVAGATNGYVRENPWRVIGIASFTALAAGFLLSRRRSS